MLGRVCDYVFRFSLVTMAFVAASPIVLGITLYDRAQKAYMRYIATGYLRDHGFVDIKVKHDCLIVCRYTDGRRLIVVLDALAGTFPMHVLSEHWAPRMNIIVVSCDFLDALDDKALYDFDEFAMERPILRCIGIEKAALSNMKIATCDGWYGLISRKFFIDEVRKEREALDS